MFSDAKSVHVAVAIVGYKNADDIRRCLRGLEDSTYGQFEVVICENGGAGAYALLSSLPSMLPGGQPVRAILAPANLGYAGGVNACLRETRQADAWWVLNPDTLPDREALRAMVHRLGRGDCELVGCTTHFSNGTVESRGGRWRPWLGRAESIDFGKSLEVAVDVSKLEAAISYFSGASMLVSRAFLERVGPMKEEYFLYGEEVEWCLRGTTLGMRLGFAPEAKVLHYQGTTTGSVADIRRRPRLPVFLDERNKILVTRDRYPSHLPITAAAAFILILMRFARRGAWRQAVYAFEGWWAGVRNRRGRPTWVAS